MLEGVRAVFLGPVLFVLISHIEQMYQGYSGALLGV